MALTIMNNDPQHIKEIEDYLAGNLTQDHRNEFEKKLRESTELQDKLNAIKQVIEGIQSYEFRRMLKSFHKKHFDNSTPEEN